ncbi:MAG: integration host factor subunit beta [Spirochaetales bacterium]|nr:integration host factor subunit beta [Spirochaetales bacterium]
MYEKKGGAVGQLKLSKAEIIENIYNKVEDVSKKKIHTIIDMIFNEVKKGIAEDKIIELRGFGTFEIKLRRARVKVRNPKTGDILPGKNHGVIIFRPGQDLKKIVWPMRE